MHGREKKLNNFHNSIQNTISPTNTEQDPGSVSNKYKCYCYCSDNSSSAWFNYTEVELVI